MKEQHLRNVLTNELNGQTRFTLHFDIASVSAVFTPGESITVTCLKLEKMRDSLIQQGRLQITIGGGK